LNGSGDGGSCCHALNNSASPTSCPAPGPG
jgi:hypothetical protein